MSQVPQGLFQKEGVTGHQIFSDFEECIQVFLYRSLKYSRFLQQLLLDEDFVMDNHVQRRNKWIEQNSKANHQWGWPRGKPFCQTSNFQGTWNKGS